jgi:hypothetical protein
VPEVSLFDSSGAAAAYIAEDQTIYLWSGQPVAYLSPDSAGGSHIYGFNGKHLGWFINGVIRDHSGKVACAIREAIASTQFEPFKAFKQFQPFKSFQEFPPFRPFFSQQWSEIPCSDFLNQGS